MPAVLPPITAHPEPREPHSQSHEHRRPGNLEPLPSAGLGGNGTWTSWLFHALDCRLLVGDGKPTLKTTAPFASLRAPSGPGDSGHVGKCRASVRNPQPPLSSSFAF